MRRSFHEVHMFGMRPYYRVSSWSLWWWLGMGGCQSPAVPQAASAVVHREEPAKAAEAAEAADPAAAAAVQQIRRAYLGRDWWACARDGAALQAQHPDSAALRAWTIACRARSGVDAVAQADVMLAEKPGEPWALFARAMALIDHPVRGEKEALPAARMAQAAAPEHPDMVWALGRALVNHGPREEAAAFFAARSAGAPAELLMLEFVHLTQTSDSNDAQALELAARARAADPESVDAHFHAAGWLLHRMRQEEAAPLLARALELSPHSPALHAQLWQSIRLAKDGSPEERRAAIDADVALLLRERGDAPEALKAVADVYEGLSPETHEKWSQELLTRFPGSREADWVRVAQVQKLMQRWYERRDKKAPDPAADAQLKAAIDAFLATEAVVPGVRGHAAMFRWTLALEDKQTPPEELLAALQAWAPLEQLNLHSLADAARELAERTSYHAEAEAVVRESLKRAEAKWSTTPQYYTPAEADSGSHYVFTIMYTALGAVQRIQGRRDEARASIERAAALQSEHTQLNIELAALAEADGKLAEAEQHLVKGMALWGGEICEKALKAMYVRQHGDDRGYARHRARLEKGLHAHRKAAVLATALAEPKPLAPFVLPRLGSGEVDSASLAGKVAVINIWSTTCGPCVKEMPDLQKLKDAYAKDRGVVVTTINNDTDIEALPKWLAEHKLALEVLLGGRYVADNGYRTFPLTLFVDPQGRVAFTQEGATEQLVEEFTWRIEALRGAG